MTMMDKGLACFVDKNTILTLDEDRSPFLIENFFDLRDERESTFDEQDLVTGDEGQENFDRKLSETGSDDAEDIKVNYEEKVDESIHETIKTCFAPDKGKTFKLNGHSCLEKAEGKGTRKRAVAHVVIRRGMGEIIVNKGEDIYWHWNYYYNSKTAGYYDVYINVKGGGISSQACATRLAIGRALVQACPAFSHLFEEDLILYEDTRGKLPKMPGRVKSRKSKSWSKR